MALTEAKLKALSANPKPGKHADGSGLFIRQNERGRMYWHTRIRRASGESEMSYGPYPKVTLKEARNRHQEARALMRQGADPVHSRRERKAAAEVQTDRQFENVARSWFKLRKEEWAEGYSSKVLRRLELDVFPFIGEVDILRLTPPEVLAVVRRVEARGVLETAHRELQVISQVFQYAVATGLAERDITHDLRRALRRPITQHFAAITDPKELGGLLRAIEGYKGGAVVRAALQLLPTLLLRPSELRQMHWSEVDLEMRRITVSPARMKRRKHGKLNGDPHIVPLPSQAVAVLRELQPLTGRSGGLVFPGERDHSRAISDNTLNAALRRMGFDTQKEITSHGFRATARTMLDERLGFEVSVIEAQLAHSVRDLLGRAYNRTQHLEKRVEMMQAWADYLDTLRKTSPYASAASEVADVAREEPAANEKDSRDAA